MDELKPCPACGGKPELQAGWSFWVECACGESTDGWSDISSAVQDWNQEAARIRGDDEVIR